MKTTTVRDIMVPLEEYATVSQDAALNEAVLALEKAQEKLDGAWHPHMHLHRTILVCDGDSKIVGKMSRLDALRSLEPKYKELGDHRSLSEAGFSPRFLNSMLRQHDLWDRPLKEICSNATDLKVKDCMHSPTEGEYIAETAPLREALHLFVIGQHQSLLVTRGDDIVGTLRVGDIFNEVFRIMKTSMP